MSDNTAKAPPQPSHCQYGSSNLPPHLKRHVSDSAFEAAVNEIEAGRYPEMHLVTPATSAASTASNEGGGSVRVYVGSQAAAGVPPDKRGSMNVDEWKAQRLADLQSKRITVVLCCCNDGSSAAWRPFESHGIRCPKACTVTVQ